jgi:hypothetical protein
VVLKNFVHLAALIPGSVIFSFPTLPYNHYLRLLTGVTSYLYGIKILTISIAAAYAINETPTSIIFDNCELSSSVGAIDISGSSNIQFKNCNCKSTISSRIRIINSNNCSIIGGNFDVSVGTTRGVSISGIIGGNYLFIDGAIFSGTTNAWAVAIDNAYVRARNVDFRGTNPASFVALTNAAQLDITNGRLVNAGAGDDISSTVGCTINAGELIYTKASSLLGTVNWVGKPVALAETLTYSDTTNKVIGPLARIPVAGTSVDVVPIKGVMQEYGVDYTVRSVTGGSAPGYYVCIGTTSTAPGGGSFSGGSNPSTGIDTVLTNGDKVRCSYSG